MYSCSTSRNWVLHGIQATYLSLTTPSPSPPSAQRACPTPLTDASPTPLPHVRRPRSSHHDPLHPAAPSTRTDAQVSGTRGTGVARRSELRVSALRHSHDLPALIRFQLPGSHFDCFDCFDCALPRAKGRVRGREERDVVGGDAAAGHHLRHDLRHGLVAVRGAHHHLRQAQAPAARRLGPRHGRARPAPQGRVREGAAAVDVTQFS